MTLDLPGPALRPELLAAGYTDEELRRARRSGEVVAIRRGAYVTVHATTGSTDPGGAARAGRARRASRSFLPVPW